MKNPIIRILAAVILMMGFWACQEEEDTIAEVIVVTPEGSRVGGAEVRMFGQGTEPEDERGELAIDETRFTNSNGVAEFDFSRFYEPGQSGLAILDVEITAELPSQTLVVSGIMKVVEEETTTKTFVLEE